MQSFPNPSVLLAGKSPLLDVSSVLAAARVMGLGLTLLELHVQSWPVIATMLGPERTQRTIEELTLVLRGTLRATDLFLAEGEGSFLVLLLGTSRADLSTVTFNVRQAVEGVRLIASEVPSSFVKLECRIATATWPEEGESLEELRQVLDQRLLEEVVIRQESERPQLRLVG